MDWGGGFRIVRVSEDRRRRSKQPAVFKSRHPKNGEDEDDDKDSAYR